MWVSWMMTGQMVIGLLLVAVSFFLLAAWFLG
jgi:hypothetical protein